MKRFFQVAGQPVEREEYQVAESKERDEQNRRNESDKDIGQDQPPTDAPQRSATTGTTRADDRRRQVLRQIRGFTTPTIRSGS